MREIISRYNLIIFLFLVLIGFLVHFKSFQMVPYGDDWRFIYNYFTHEEVVADFSPFPGILSYLAPYGPSILTIGFLYKVFGSQYYIYYLVPLIFKIFISFLVFLILQNISSRLKKGDYFVNFLSSVLFLVGTTGIQAIDWAFHINVYIAILIFLIGLFFQINFFNYSGKLNLLSALFFSILSILLAPFRLLLVVLLAPLSDFILLFKSKVRQKILIVVLKNLAFAVFIFSFFWAGLFGHEPRDIYSPFPILDSIKQVISDPFLTTKTFLHWIGIAILPAYPSGAAYSFIVGAVFLVFLLMMIYKYRSKYIILGSILFIIPLASMWLITPTRFTDSGDKYLPLSFLGLSFLIGVLSLYIDKLKYIFKIIILGLVLVQGFSTIKIYSNWMTIGRGADFILPIQRTIMHYFPSPINELKIIYLDFDDAAVQQSIEFGLGYRVAVLSGTKGLGNFPLLVSKEENLIKLIHQEYKNNRNKEIIDAVTAFRYKDKKFYDITVTTREHLRSSLSLDFL